MSTDKNRMVIIPVSEGESISVTQEELDKLGRQGVIEKYAACMAESVT